MLCIFFRSLYTLLTLLQEMQIQSYKSRFWCYSTLRSWGLENSALLLWLLYITSSQNRTLALVWRFWLSVSWIYRCRRLWWSLSSRVDRLKWRQSSQKVFPIKTKLISKRKLHYEKTQLFHQMGKRLQLLWMPTR